MTGASNTHSQLRWQGQDEVSVQGFVRRYFFFSLALTTAIGSIITVLPDSHSGLVANLVFSYCVGFTIFLLHLLTRVFVLRRVAANVAWNLVIHAATIPLGFMIGIPLGSLLTGESVGDLTVGVLFASMGGSFALLYTASVEQRRQAEQAEKAAVTARLQTLQAQVEPHFLFNTLASLDALIGVDDARAHAILAHLNHYLRASLEHARSGAATLETEFALLRAYLAIMRMRLPNRLQLRIECDAECAALPFPPMLVQPLVENAVTHGIEPAAHGGEVAVIARRASDRLLVTVRDTGVGWGRAPTGGSGTGFANVRERLAALYGRAASLRAQPLEPHGTVVELSIPIALLRPEH